jgi:hypothetical protein
MTTEAAEEHVVGEAYKHGRQTIYYLFLAKSRQSIWYALPLTTQLSLSTLRKMLSISKGGLWICNGWAEEEGVIIGILVSCFSSGLLLSEPI